MFSKIRENKASYYFVNILLSVLFLLPLLWTASTSLKEAKDITKYPPDIIPRSFSLENYQELFSFNDGAFIGYTINSIILTLGTIVCVIIIGGLAAYGFSKVLIPFKTIFFTLIMAAIMIPFHGLLIPLFSVMDQLNLVNTYVALIIIYVTFQLPIGIFMLKNAFDAIPDSLHEAAMVDGMSNIQIFYKIILPLSWPGIATVAIYVAYTTWNDFVIALIFATSDDMQTLNVGLTNLTQGEFGTSWGLLSSGSIVSIIPMIILFMFLQRYFISGLTSGFGK